MDLKRTGFSLLMLILFAAGWFYYIGGGLKPFLPDSPYISPFTDLEGNYAWAKEAVDFLASKNIITGMTDTTFAPSETVTREQLATLLTTAFNLPTPPGNTTQSYSDVPTSRWSFAYIEGSKELLGITDERFQPTKVVTREEAAASIIRGLKLSDSSIENPNLLDERFTDSILVDSSLKDLVIIAVQRGVLDGDNNKLTPQLSVKRAEIAVMLYRVLTDAKTTQTPIMGASLITAERAKEWAQSRNADQRFIEIADIYWKYGSEFGIRPEVLYCQAAKETNFGKYTGRVTADMNNWAGIKTNEATGDQTEDHQRFDTADDGVRAHFNHMSAYTGTKTVGQTHPRYDKVKSIEWAGTVKNVEDLGGKWAPDANYGNSIVSEYLIDIVK